MLKDKTRLTLFVLTLGALVWGFRVLLFEHVPMVFSDGLEDMSYAWYIPVFSLYVLWTERAKVLEALGEPSAIGMVLTLPFLVVGFLGARGVQVRFEILGLVGLLLAIPWAFYGKRLAFRILFPVGYLLFCIPLATFLDVFTVHLRILATSTAFEVLRGFGADVVRRGTMILANDGSFSIDVADPCSGLRSIFALAALTVAYAYFSQKTWTKCAVLSVCAIPLAVLGNIARILTICLIANYASPEFATGFYHDYSGYVVFFVAILAMVAVGESLSRFGRGKGAQAS